MIEQILGVPFPVEYSDTRMTENGLIDSTSRAAVQWNKYKIKLRKKIEAGNRWVDLAQRFGWSVLGLITRDSQAGQESIIVSHGM